MNTLLVIVVLLLVIALHEAGHVIAARLRRLPVQEFAIGMGPRIAGLTVRGVPCNLRALPIGGYVKCDALESGSLTDKTVVAMGGPAVQFIVGGLIIAPIIGVLDTVRLIGTLIGATFAAVVGLPGVVWDIITNASRDDGVGGVGAITSSGSSILATTDRPILVVLLMLFAVLNIGIGALQLIPLPPLDGGHVLRAVADACRVPKDVTLVATVGCTLVVVASLLLITAADFWNPSA